MKMKSTSYGSRPTILAADGYVTVLYHNQELVGIKAGASVSGFNVPAGRAGDGTGSTGIALYDIPAGENGALVVAGVIDAEKCAESTGNSVDFYLGMNKPGSALIFRAGIKNQD